MHFKLKALWSIFFLTLVATAANLNGKMFSINLLNSGILNSLILLVPVLLLILHASWTMSYSRGSMFVFLACLIGFVIEYVGLSYGSKLGGSYRYSAGGMGVSVVPINVILYWSVFIYIGYSITNTFLLWLGKNKPSINKANISLLVLLTVIDSIIVVTIDLFMDPLQVYLGRWEWVNGGAYFGVPLRNFVGWIIAVLIFSGIFRTYEYLRPIKQRKRDENIYLIPVLSYTLLYLSFLIYSVSIGLHTLALIGTLLMFPIILMNLYLFLINKKAYLFK